MKILVGVVTTLLFLLYPVAIWVGLTHFSARTVGLWILALVIPAMLLRFRRAKREDLFAALRVPMVILAVVLLGVVFDDPRFVLAMPVLVNATLLLTFGLSLAGTPIIERFARMQEKDGLSDAQVSHCRQVTWAWMAFFLLNGAVALLLALFAPVSWWAAYNGGVAYGLMGLMFTLEYALRQYRFRRYGGGLHDRLLSRMFPPNEMSRPRPAEDRSEP